MRSLVNILVHTLPTHVTSLVSMSTTTRNFAGEYTGTYSNTFTNNYSRDFAGNYARDFVNNFRTTTQEHLLVSTLVRIHATSLTTSQETTRGFAGEYAGTYTRDFGENYVGNYSVDFRTVHWYILT